MAVGSESEIRIGDWVTAECPRSVNLAGKTTLSQLISILSRAKCVLTNDSGTMHLAAALNKMGVAIFGSTDPVATGPLGGQWIVLRQELYCSPCLKRTCYRKDTPYECLKSITPNTVIENIQLLCGI